MPYKSEIPSKNYEKSNQKRFNFNPRHGCSFLLICSSPEAPIHTFMASVTQTAYILRWVPFNFSSQNCTSIKFSPFSHRLLGHGKVSFSIYGHVCRTRKSFSPTFTCSAANKPSDSSSDIRFYWFISLFLFILSFLL